MILKFKKMLIWQLKNLILLLTQVKLHISQIKLKLLGC